MKTIAAWAVFATYILRYPFYRMGLLKRLSFIDQWMHIQLVFRQITGMDHKVRLRGLEHVPQKHPAIYAGNHTKLDDPFYLCYAVQEATKYRNHIRFVMRDDFFEGFPWTILPVDVNEVARMGGAHLISLDNVQLSQLKPLIQLLGEPFSFGIFPGRSRSRSGLTLEYRDGIEEPGSVAFFLAQAQRKHSGTPIPAVPVARTCNPVSGVSTVNVGPPHFLPAAARREEQRAFDDALVVAIGELVEINMPHVVSGLLYLYCLHGYTAAISHEALLHAAETALTRCAHRFVDPAAQTHGKEELARTLKYLAQLGAVQRQNGVVRPDVRLILSAPPLDTRYRRTNPVKHLANQILHFADVVAILEENAQRLGR
ncbi:MAG: 1-acyl-sn-glycerol-3-phosphate acyltransferase [Candidatus Hydrogenedentes bacterium]|nr:1-acyl-sn-glycerol-3-phosphate acyltransferase [Candidatus Hydrogenedentota bacterium]